MDPKGTSELKGKALEHPEALEPNYPQGRKGPNTMDSNPKYVFQHAHGGNIDYVSFRSLCSFYVQQPVPSIAS